MVQGNEVEQQKGFSHITYTTCKPQTKCI